MSGPRSAAVIRTAGRVLLIDGGGSVLLLEHRAGVAAGDEQRCGTVWAAPGGGCEVGESTLEAACRELFEECGITVDLGPAAVPVHAERRCWSFEGVTYDQTDYFYLVRVEGRPEVIRDHRTELEAQNMFGHRWFSADELRTGLARWEPAALIELLVGVTGTGLAAGGAE